MEVENAFLLGDELHKIRSVIYTNEEIDGSTVFYFSPTRGITDIDGMEEAGDFLRVCVDDTGGAPIDFSKGYNSVSYKDVVINKDNISTLQSRRFEIEMLDHKYMSISFDFTMEDGNVFRAHYYGASRKYPYDASAEWDYVAERLTVQAGYMGSNETTGTSSYVLTMASSNYETDGTGTNFWFDEDGYLVIVYLFGEANAESSTVFPTGTFRMGLSGEAGTYDGRDRSGVMMYEVDNPTPVNAVLLEDDIEISSRTNDAGRTIYTVEITFTDEEGVSRIIGYEGDLPVVSMNTDVSYIDEPKTDFKGVSAAGMYLGNIFETNSGLTLITLYDEAYDTENAEEGYSVSLGVFSQLFNGETAPHIIPGKYTIKASPFGEKGSALVGQMVSMMGTPFPFGTFMQHVTQGELGAVEKYGMGASGTIEIEEKGTVEVENEEGVLVEKTNYAIVFDFLTQQNVQIAGTYEGPVDVEDASDDDVKDDGTSTLNNDYEMQLGNIPVAHLVPCGEAKYPLGDDLSAWADTNGDGVVDDKDKDSADPPVGHQIIKIGTYADGDYVLGEGNTGDTFSLALVTRLGEDNKLAPGKYPILLENWPAFFKAGAAMKGQFVNFGGTVDMQYTLWNHYDPDRGWIRDGHACIYDGYAEVTRDPGDEAGVFTISLNGYCVRQYNVTGTWTGKIVGPDGKPVEAAEPLGDNTVEDTPSRAESLMRANADMMKQAAFCFKSQPSSR